MRHVEFAAFKRELVQEHGGQCLLCGWTPASDEAYAAFDFHHRDPSEKRFAISAGSAARSEASLREEAGKCDVLCANCHRTVHAVEGWTENRRSIDRSEIDEVVERWRASGLTKTRFAKLQAPSMGLTWHALLARIRRRVRETGA